MTTTIIVWAVLAKLIESLIALFLLLKYKTECKRFVAWLMSFCFWCRKK